MLVYERYPGVRVTFKNRLKWYKNKRKKTPVNPQTHETFSRKLS